MPLELSLALEELKRLDLAGLRTRYHELFGEAPSCRHRVWLVRRIAWRIQALAEGDLSERACKRALELANHADLRLMPPRPPRSSGAPLVKLVEATAPAEGRLPVPGTQITRNYKGRQLSVTVRQDDFEFEGKTYQSLSAIAKEVTGSHWNGFYFFGLAKKARKA